jgi:Na+-translocating ferredoxin:NAD+ oxidoreductase RnfE subunit
MTNGEWLKSKRDNFVQKFRDWIYKHIWIPIIIFAIFITVTIYVTVFMEKLFIVSLYPLGMSEFIFISIAVCQWLDKEHKEK